MTRRAKSIVPKIGEPDIDESYIRQRDAVLLETLLIDRTMTAAFNQAVKRNENRFPLNFRFQLTKEEHAILISQTVISKREKGLETRGGYHKLPYVFTEQGIAMLSGVLRSDVGKKNDFPCVSDRILSRSFFGIESNFVELNPNLVKQYKRGMPIDFAKEVKLFTNDKAGKAGRAQWYVAKRNVIKDNQKFIDQWKVVVSRANAGGQKRDWQIEVFDNHSAFGRARVGLGSFKTKAEAENFYAYCKTYLVRFLFLMTEESLTSLAKKVPDVLDYTKSNKLLDFSKDLNKQLYTLCNLTAAEVKYIEKPSSTWMPRVRGGRLKGLKSCSSRRCLSRRDGI